MKEYILDLDKPRVLKFGFLALKKIELKFGKLTVDQILALKNHDWLFVAWAGLIWEDKELSVDQLMEKIDDSIPKKNTITSIIEITAGAFTAHFGGPKKVQASAIAAAEKHMKKLKVEKETEKKEEVTLTIPSSKPQKK